MYTHNLKKIFGLKPIKSTVLRILKGCSTKLQARLSSFNKENFKVGETYHGFTVTNVTPIELFSLDVVELRHNRTQSKYFHLVRDDDNNVFSVQFRTTPLDSTGKPHILEHNVLCGSKRYPVRDPFFKMLNRSLATFMNAMTGADYTMYPFSTTNEKDFRNLQSIYLDAVFNPNLKESDFMQEGWRFEHTDLGDPHSNITIKGVVYNEMKGVFAENERIVSQKLISRILPDHTYGVVSGGEPLDIPNLTYEGLKDFHRRHYHPTNCHFFSYGNFPLIPTLEVLDNEYLKDYATIDVRYTEVPTQQRWEAQQREDITYRLDKISGHPMAKQNSIMISYLMNDIKDIYGTFLMQFLTELLMKGPNSPFYKSLIEPNISGGFTPNCGYDFQTKDSTFILGLQGVEVTQFDKVLEIFDKTIDTIIKDGFDAEQIETVLHGYELGTKHEASNFGLRLLFNLAPLMNHEATVTDALKIDKLIRQLKHDMKTNPKFLQECVNKYFKKNKHRLVLTASPDPEYETKLVKAEEEMLKTKISALDSTKRAKLFDMALQLQHEQNSPQQTDLLPSLQLQDIRKSVQHTKAIFDTITQVPIQMCDAPTNGITYLKMVLKTNSLVDHDHRMLVPLFNYVITKLGTAKHNYREFDTIINKKTSGLSLSSHIVDNLKNNYEFEQGILLSSYCLDANVEAMLNIWSEIFSISALNDVQRLEMLTKMYMANLTHGIAISGHLYAMQIADSLVSGAGYERELLNGMRHIKYMVQLVANSPYDKILEKLNEMVRILFNKDNFRLAVNTLPSNRRPLLQKLDKFISYIPGAAHLNINTIKYQSRDMDYFPGTLCQHNIVNMPVFFCSKTIKTVPYIHEDFPKLRILAKLLSAKHLHPTVREKNGAYGVGAHLSMGGLFGFFSYRDPNNLQTLQAFDDSYTYVVDNIHKLTDQDIFEAKLSLFQQIDAPIIPADIGGRLFMQGLTDEMLATNRSRILATTKQDILDTAEGYLNPAKPLFASKVILGPKLATHSAGDSEKWSVVDTE